MDNFEKGDFIRLKNIWLYKIDPIHDKEINIFEILEINDTYVKITDCIQKIPRSEIEAIPINGIDDFKIYYDPIIAATVVDYGDPAPLVKTNKSYYLEALKNVLIEGNNLKDLVQGENCRYVNEIQHLLRNLYGESRLKIDAI